MADQFTFTKASQGHPVNHHRNPFDRFPVHLHHAKKEPIVAHDAETEQNARDAGYTDTYQQTPAKTKVTATPAPTPAPTPAA